MYSCFLYLSISLWISYLYRTTSSSKSTSLLAPNAMGCVFCLNLGMLVVPVKFFLNLRSLILEAIFSPVGVSLVLYVRGGSSCTQSGSGIAHLALSGSSGPGLLSYVGQSLKPALFCSTFEQVHCHMTVSSPWVDLAFFPKSAQGLSFQGEVSTAGTIYHASIPGSFMGLVEFVFTPPYRTPF